MTTKLLLIDFQNDFITGSLAVNGAVQDVKNTVDFIKRNQDDIDKVVFTADMHPKNHISFRSSWVSPYDTVSLNDVIDGDCMTSFLDKETLLNYMYEVNNVQLYPDHCVAGTNGALIDESIEDIVDMCFGVQQSTYLKGISAMYEQYSAMYSYANGINFKFLNEFKDCEKIYVAGEAFDVCVYNTVNDMIKLGVNANNITVLSDCTTSIYPLCGDRLQQVLEQLGVSFKSSKEVL